MANKKRNISKTTAIVLIAAAAAILLAVVLLLCIPGVGPVEKFEKAAKKTIFAENFTTQFTFKMNGDTIDGTINAAVGPEARKLEMYMQLSTHVSDYICGIYNGSFAVCDMADNQPHTTDISQQVDAFFDALESDGEPDWALLLDIGGTDLYGKISQDFDFDVLLTCLGDFLNTLNDTNWAEAYAGYSKDREEGITVYRFQPDPYMLVTQSLPLFEPAFRETEDYSDLLAYVDNAKYLLMDGKADFSFGIRGGKLVSADFTLQYHNTEISGSFSFIGIGSTTVDTETIAIYIDEASK